VALKKPVNPAKLRAVVLQSRFHWGDAQNAMDYWVASILKSILETAGGRLSHRISAPSLATDFRAISPKSDRRAAVALS
jgi:hypothetical protein